MTPLETAFSAFHFLRPLVLLGLLPLALIWWRSRRPKPQSAPVTDAIAPHLRTALTVGRSDRQRVKPIDLVSLCLALLLLGAAGPTWSRIPAPFSAQTAPMVVALKVTPSMENNDLAPSRLERAKQKVTDLLHLRAGARTALVAYSGTAHVVVPMTEDAAVLQPYLEGLAPDVLPVEGDAPLAALSLAQDLLTREDAPSGGVLFVLDDLSVADGTSLQEQAEGTALAFLTMLPEGQSIPALATTNAQVQSATADTTDLRRLERGFQAAFQQAQLQDGSQPWRDRGLYLAWPAAMFLLLWFRRGVAVQLALFCGVALLGLTPGSAQAQQLGGWFFTPDQQGWRAFQNKDYAAAADRFADPYLRGLAQYRGGQYEAAAQTLSQIDTADAAFAQGMANIKSRGYRDGVRAFERALTLDPNHAAAKANLPVAQEIVDYIERVREQSDTGEDTGIGADDVVFDNEAAKGVDTQIDAPQEDAPEHLTTEQWMQTVDTSTGDFLRQRFRLEAAGADQ